MRQVFAVLAAAMTVGAGAAAAQDFEFTHNAAAGTRFVLRNIVGTVRLEAGSGRSLTVTARKKAGRHGDPADVEIKAVELDDGVAICVYYPSSGRGSSSRRGNHDRDGERDRGRRRSDDPCSRGSDWGNNDRNDTSIDFAVRLPAGLRVDAKTVAGDLIGNGLRGTLELGTVSGDLLLTDVEGAVLDVSSVSGNLEMDRVRVREVSAETVSGDVTFAGPIDSQGRYDFKTLSGEIVMTLPRQPEATVSAVTFSGDLESVFPMSTGGGRSRRHRFNATWGSGSARVDLESFSGDIRIRESR